MGTPFYRPTIDYSLAIELIPKILNSGILVNGQYTEKLEQHFIDKFGVKHAIACASCTAGLTISIKAAGICGSYVGLPAFTWPSTRYAIECNSCKPSYYDIDKNTWLVKWDEKIFHKPDLLIAVDTFGNEYVPDTKSKLIIDAAHSYGLKNLGKRGLVEVVSLAATKLVTGGQGGVILTNDDNIAAKARDYVRTYAKITEINALIGLLTIKDYNRSQIIRRRLVNRYRDGLSTEFKEQEIPSETNHSVFGILFKEKKCRDRAVEALKSCNIEYKMYYEPLANNLENTNYVYERILCLPLYPQIENKIGMITSIVNEYSR